MAAPVEKGNVVVAIVYDFETGGLDCTKCAATQISLHAVRLDTFEVMEKYQAYIYPYNKKENIGKPKKKVLKNKPPAKQAASYNAKTNKNPIVFFICLSSRHNTSPPHNSRPNFRISFYTMHL